MLAIGAAIAMLLTVDCNRNSQAEQIAQAAAGGSTAAADEHTVMPNLGVTNLGVTHHDAIDIAGYLYTLK